MPEGGLWGGTGSGSHQDHCRGMDVQFSGKTMLAARTERKDSGGKKVGFMLGNMKG